jgi:capsular polysaccharide biosynthesis protein
MIASVLVGVGYALLVQPTEYTASVLLEVCYKESSVEDGSGDYTSEKNSSAQSVYQFARYLPKGYEVLFTSTAYINDYNLKVKDYNSENPEVAKQLISEGGLNFAIDDDLDVLFTVSYTISNKGLSEEEMRTQVVDTINGYLNESIAKTNANTKSMYADRLNIISSATESAVKVNKGSVKTVAIAVLAGLVIIFAVLLIKYLSDDTIALKEDVEDLTGTIVIAYIPLISQEVKTQEKGDK